MKKKILSVLFVLGLVVLSSFVLASYDSEAAQAYRCLDDAVNKTSPSALNTAFFSALADATFQNVLSKIDNEASSTGDCWPSASCTIKDTAIGALVQRELGNETEEIIDWLKAHTKVSQDLIWYLQISIDTNDASSCTVIYDNSEHSVSIDDEMKVSGSPGNCLSVSSSGYWLRINNDCLDKEFGIVCDKSFKTNLLYQKSNGGTVFVSSKTTGKSAGERSTEKVSAKCFGTGTGCDYEGSLWATAALYDVGEDTSEYTPYLIALAEDHEQYMPSAFLVYILGETAGGEQYTKLMESRRLGGYWEESQYGKYYDTALAILALGGKNSQEIVPTTEWLFEDMQEESGCWNGGNILETAFILYAGGWVRGPPLPDCVEDNDCSSGACVANVCVECDEDSDCDSDACVNNVCAECNEDSDCETDACVNNVCAECNEDSDCETDACVNNVCAECNEDSDCETDACIDNVCAECSIDTDCNEGDVCSNNICEEDPGNPLPPPNPSVPNVCGNGSVEGIEICECGADGICGNLDDLVTGQSCILQGFKSGSLYCNATCSGYLTSGCSNGSGGGGDTPVTITDCELSNNFCVASAGTCIAAGGSVLPSDSYSCEQFVKKCCTVEVETEKETCSDMGGETCTADESCPESTVTATDGQCCLYGCVSGGTTDSCSSLGGDCRSSCNDDENVISGTCADTLNECCYKSGTDSDEEGSSLWLWIIIFLILIALVVLGIIYKDKLRVWWFKMRGKAKSSKIPPSGRGPPPGMQFRRRPAPRFAPRNMQKPAPGMARRPARPPMRPPTRPVSRPTNSKDKELAETMRKLREMSK